MKRDADPDAGHQALINGLRKAAVPEDRLLRMAALRFANLTDEIARAQAGDTQAARDLLLQIVFHCDAHDPKPMPADLLRYLGCAMYRIISHDEDAGVALNLKRPGAPTKHSHLVKLKVGIRIDALVADGASIGKACNTVATEIQDDPGRCGLTEAPDVKTLARMFDDVKDEIAGMRHAISSTQ